MYESFYRLNAKPFQLSPDPRFFFNSRGHKRALSYLRYGVEQGEGFIVITGGIGTGKTTLVRALFNEITDKNIVAAQVVTSQLDADDMLHLVAASFGIEHKNLTKATVLKNLETFLVLNARRGKRALLVVDEAQNLPEKTLEELRMLSNFQVNDRPLLQTFLLGQQEFRQTLLSPQMEQLRQRVIAAHHLSALLLDETRGYIEHRLKTVGWNQDPAFTADAFAKIYRYTDGVPRKINTLCDRLLLNGFLEELHEINNKVVEQVAEELIQETAYLHDIHGEQPLDVESVAAVPVENQQPAAAEAPDKERLASDSMSADGVMIMRRLSAIEERMASIERLLRGEDAEQKKATS